MYAMSSSTNTSVTSGVPARWWWLTAVRAVVFALAPARCWCWLKNSRRVAQKVETARDGTWVVDTCAVDVVNTGDIISTGDIDNTGDVVSVSRSDSVTPPWVASAGWVVRMSSASWMVQPAEGLNCDLSWSSVV